MIRDRAAGPVEGLEFRGAEQARPTEQVLGGDRGRARDRDRAVQPARLDRADPRRAGHPRGARRAARAGRRRQPDRRRRGAEGPDGRVHGVRRARAAAPAAWPTSTASCSTASSPTRTSTASCRRCAPTRAWTTPTARARLAEQTLDFADASPAERRHRDLRDARQLAGGYSRQALQRVDRAADRRVRGTARGRWRAAAARRARAPRGTRTAAPSLRRPPTRAGDRPERRLDLARGGAASARSAAAGSALPSANVPCGPQNMRSTSSR